MGRGLRARPRADRAGVRRRRPDRGPAVGGRARAPGGEVADPALLGNRLLDRAPGSGLSVLDGALAGVRVLDFTHFLAGQYAGLTLADLGADVIRIENVDRPDHARNAGPHHLDGHP